MTGFLASVRTVEEARTAFNKKVDIIDLKEPSLGALGAVPETVIKEVVQNLRGKSRISATVGDLIGQPEVICPAVERTEACGVDIIKVGLFDNYSASLLPALGQLARQGSQIVIVAFADKFPGLNLIEEVAEAGLMGIMLDTAEKKSGSLCDVMTQKNISEFTRRARSYQLMTGLAGSLKTKDIPSLLEHQPDYLGFRGALCDHHDRIQALNAELITEVRMLIPKMKDVNGGSYGAVA